MAKTKKPDLNFESPKTKTRTPDVEILNDLIADAFSLAGDEKIRLNYLKKLTDLTFEEKIKK